MSLPSINFLHLTVSEIQARQTFPAARADTMGENNTLTALKGCGVKTVAVTVLNCKQNVSFIVFSSIFYESFLLEVG